MCLRKQQQQEINRIAQNISGNTRLVAAAAGDAAIFALLLSSSVATKACQPNQTSIKTNPAGLSTFRHPANGY